MGSSILLLCSLPPLAVLAVALIHGLRSESSTVFLTLSLSALVFSAAIVLPLQHYLRAGGNSHELWMAASCLLLSSRPKPQ